MRILVVVHDLIAQKSHLMPWRTVCEVVRYMRQDGHDAHLLSLGVQRAELSGGLIPEGSWEICKASDTLAGELISVLKEIRPDIIFWPVTWRESAKKIQVVTDHGIPVVLWYPGGVYSLAACAHALKVMGIRNTLPYLREAISPRTRQVRHFRDMGIRAIVAMTEVTARSAVEAGWPDEQTFVIPPGKENAEPEKGNNPLPADFKQWLAGSPYYLFMGPPSGIRGIFDLLKAFDLAAKKNKEIRLVCLFRSDGTLESRKVKRSIDKCRYKDGIFAVWQSLKIVELNNYMAACHAVTMPFVMVPSEIPLAIIEAMAWGKPIITTSPGGTGEFVEKFGLSPKVGDIHGLADAMLRLLQDKLHYRGKCQATEKAYQRHPDWRLVSQLWANIALGQKRP